MNKFSLDWCPHLVHEELALCCVCDWVHRNIWDVDPLVRVFFEAELLFDIFTDHSYGRAFPFLFDFSRIES